MRRSAKATQAGTEGIPARQRLEVRAELVASRLAFGASSGTGCCLRRDAVRDALPLGCGSQSA